MIKMRGDDTRTAFTVIVKVVFNQNPLKEPYGSIFVVFKGFTAFLFWFSRYLVDILYFVITMGYAANVLTYGRKKPYVLKKSAMELVYDLISEYSAADFDQDCIIKCNTNTKLVSHNRLFFNQMVALLFDPRNIKHPDSRLGPILEKIERLRADGTLQAMIETSGQDAFVEQLINRFSSVESDYQ